MLVRDGLAWRCTAEAATAQVPATLHGLLLARVDRLDAAERQVIQEAAVIGPRFEVPLLKAVSAEPAAVDAALDALVGADLVTPGPDHRFRHGLLQEIVYQNILVARRTELHTPGGRRPSRPRARATRRVSSGWWPSATTGPSAPTSAGARGT